MDALRIAQDEHGGWLPPEALREVADALDVTPAYCHSIASFYDMYHLEPVGEHLVEVCTNLSCALVGAQAVLDAFAEAYANDTEPVPGDASRTLLKHDELIKRYFGANTTTLAFALTRALARGFTAGSQERMKICSPFRTGTRSSRGAVATAMPMAAPLS